MVAFRFLLSCSIAPSLLIEGVVVEKSKQLGMDDYYEASYVDPACPGAPAAHPHHEKSQKFAAELFDPVPASHINLAAALKKFLFHPRLTSKALTNDSIPSLFAAGMTVGPAQECKEEGNWEIVSKVDKAADMSAGNNGYICDDCGYDVGGSESGRKIIDDIVAFGNVYGSGVTKDQIPKIWCHNPNPSNTDPILKSQWRGTGGYYNVLKCKTSKYSVIGFAGEKKDTCYPFHIHKSYELYWTIGGKATWKAHKGNNTPDGTGVPKYAKYGIGQGAAAEYELHKHDPMVSHEIVTAPGDHTTQIYFWSMSQNDAFSHDVNAYDIDAGAVDFSSSTNNSPEGSCYNDPRYKHIGPDNAVVPNDKKKQGRL